MTYSRMYIMIVTVRIKKQIMSKDKYLSSDIFALNGGYCFIIL